MGHTYYANEMLVKVRIAEAQSEMEHERAAQLSRMSRQTGRQPCSPAIRHWTWLRGWLAPGITWVASVRSSAR